MTQVNLLDPAGRLVRQWQPAGKQQLQLSLTALPAGMYTLIATSVDGHRKTGRIQIK